MKSSFPLQPLLCSNVSWFNSIIGPHVARVCRNFLAKSNFIPLDRPPYSLDVYPIEHLCDEHICVTNLKGRRIQKRRNILNQMRNASLDEWNFIPLEEDQCINELHAKKNKGDNSGESGAHQILIYTVNFHSFIYSVRGNFFGLTVLRRWSRCWSYSLVLCGLFCEAICCMSFLVLFCSCVFQSF